MDLVPLGDIEAPDRTITWPDGTTVMNLIGHQEAAAICGRRLAVSVGERSAVCQSVFTTAGGRGAPGGGTSAARRRVRALPPRGVRHAKALAAPRLRLSAVQPAFSLPLVTLPRGPRTSCNESSVISPASFTMRIGSISPAIRCGNAALGAIAESGAPGCPRIDVPILRQPP